ncbi:hypothetical protein GGR28_001007 [Lewinella aquimaris]|uniref:Uncharacterized protein n=1 Tax=Neolewinella aquimaris TaxID=1835722 RepID=A0A840DYQ4_9BACT|nr:hypothetical protein [Neolewinella aquimaris]MBB4078394.1 hypothetical protein [Neolewinella aquimaris]
MKIHLAAILLFLTAFSAYSCSSTDEREGEIDANEVIATEPDYEDGDQDGDGEVSYEEQSPRSSITTQTTNYANRADSLRIARDTLVDPKYTDDEYEAAFSTSTTNPKNQVEGGVTPGNQKKNQ